MSIDRVPHRKNNVMLDGCIKPSYHFCSVHYLCTVMVRVPSCGLVASNLPAAFVPLHGHVTNDLMLGGRIEPASSFSSVDYPSTVMVECHHGTLPLCAHRAHNVMLRGCINRPACFGIEVLQIWLAPIGLSLSLRHPRFWLPNVCGEWQTSCGIESTDISWSKLDVVSSSATLEFHAPRFFHLKLDALLS